MDYDDDNLKTISKIKLKLTYGDPNNIRTVCQRVSLCDLQMGENNIKITSKKILRLFRHSNLTQIFHASLIITYGGLSEVTIDGGDFTVQPNTQYPDSDSSYDSDDSYSCYSSGSCDSCDSCDSSSDSSYCSDSSSDSSCDSDSSDSCYESDSSGSCYESDSSDSSDSLDSSDSSCDLDSCYSSDILDILDSSDSSCDLDSCYSSDSVY